MQVACLLVPDVSLAAVLRAEPELRGRPVGVTDGATIVAGWLRGLTLAQALAIEPALEVRPLSLEGVRSTQEALVDVGLSVSPRVQDAAPGRVFVDLCGTESAFPTPGSVCTALETRLERVGLAGARIGLGPGCTVALLAARHQGGGHRVSASGVARFVESLPLDLLDPPDEVFDRLTRWGIHTLGELARLPRKALGARLGASGVRLARRARGEDLDPFEPTSPRLRFEESVAFETAIDRLDPLAFALRSVLDRLTGRLRLRGLAVHELWLELDLEDHRRHARRVGVGAPTLEIPTLTTLVRLMLEGDPPGSPVERLRVIATPGQVEPAQLDLFLPPLPAPAELATTVARLEALCGTHNVGAPGLENTHRPDAATLTEFAVRPPDPRSPSQLPRATLALRILRPPWRVRVHEREGVPHRVELVRDLRVTERAGPWRLFGEWWGESCFARDYFDVALSDGALYRLYHNLIPGDDTWYIDGIYD